MSVPPLDPIAGNTSRGTPSFFNTELSQLLDRTILDEHERQSFRPWLHRLIDVFLFCSLIGILMLLHGGLLLTPPALSWAWLTLSGGSLFLIRLDTHVTREFLVSMLVCSISVLGWVAIVNDPMSSLISFCNLIFITVLVLTLTPRAGLAVLLLNFAVMVLIRTVQLALHIEAGLAAPPQSWIQGGQVGVIFLIHFVSVWFLVNLIWQQKERNREALAQLELSNTHLVASEQARSVFLSTVTHELRTPLTSIRGYTELLLVSADKHPDGLGIIQRAAVKLESLVDEFINLADPPSLASRMTLQLVQLEKLVADEVAGLQRQARLQGATLHFLSLSSCAVQADPIRISQVVSNLVENAIQHTPSGNSITVTLATEEEWAVLKIQDTGAGISADDLQHVFHPFFSKESSVKKRKGAGLGLTICKQIVQASRGDIAVESTPGRGTTFTVRLPLVRVLPSREASTARREPQQGKRVLVMDDDPGILKLMEAAISRMGIAVETAIDGPSALELALHKEFDVIILDINVPELSGIEVSRRLRRAGSQAKIFLFSAMPAHEAKAAMLDAQADGFIPKPFHYDDLVEKLRGAGLALTV